jgi:hypothetical protein
MFMSKAEETKKVLVEVPKKANSREVKKLVKNFFSFDFRRFYGKDKDFPMVRIKWKPSV